jgi:epoxyqueuosine reductase
VYASHSAGHGSGIIAMTLVSAIKARAEELGFIACGITHPGPTAHGDRLDEWFARGYAGTMRYLHRQAKRRKNPGLIAPDARSVVVVLDNYYTPDQQSDLQPPRVAKYARGEDYHRVTQRRLAELADFLRINGARLSRVYADAGPVPERELAQRAGLGWIGKNTMLIAPGAGSFFFIGSVFTDLQLDIDSPFDLDRCGSCTRCLDACPTDAFVEPRVLDATRCISYLTIEQRGPIPEHLAAQFEGYAFGCDICNDVCPWNQRFARLTSIAEFQPRGWPPQGDPEFFQNMTEDAFAGRFGDTPLERPGLEGMRRNFRAAFASSPVASR